MCAAALLQVVAHSSTLLHATTSWNCCTAYAIAGIAAALDVPVLIRVKARHHSSRWLQKKKKRHVAPKIRASLYSIVSVFACAAVVIYKGW
jgi:hypothetical protein